MTETRRTFLRATGAAAASLCTTPLFAQRDPAADYPNRPIKLVCPFAPAGGTDITARAIAQKLTEAWGQAVVVDNKVGANGTIGVSHSPSDTMSDARRTGSSSRQRQRSAGRASSPSRRHSRRIRSRS